MSGQAVPRMLQLQEESESLGISKDQEAMMFNAGYMGWVLYGALACFNTLYYMDVYKRQYMDNYRVNNSSVMALWTTFAGSNFMRLKMSMILWFAMLLGWAIASLGWTFPVLHVFYYGMAEVFIVIWVIRTLLLLVMQCISFVTDNYSGTYGAYNYYSEVATLDQLNIGDLYDSIDLELESFNIIAQVAAFGLYSVGQPVFHAQVRKSKIIHTEGASCSLCFKRRQATDTESSTKKSNWVTTCNRIRAQCEDLARDEAAKIANRRATSEADERDVLNFMF